MTTKHITRASVLAAARKRWGKDVQLRENKRAPTAARREELRARLKAAQAREQEARAALLGKPQNTYDNDLLAAAEFVVAVKGDHPSIEQLAAAVEKAQWYRQQRAAIADKETVYREVCNAGMITFRWNIGSLRNLAGLANFSVVHAQADTLEELMGRIENA